jgi:hypothetical protein
MPLQSDLSNESCTACKILYVALSSENEENVYILSKQFNQKTYIQYILWIFPGVCWASRKEKLTEKHNRRSLLPQYVSSQRSPNFIALHPLKLFKQVSLHSLSLFGSKQNL